VMEKLVVVDFAPLISLLWWRCTTAGAACMFKTRAAPQNLPLERTL
jgi:hypothetical protein